MQVKMLVERLTAAARFDIHFVARLTDPEFKPDGYEIHRVGSHRDLAGSFFLDVPNLTALLNRLQPDVIYQRVACAYTGAAAYFARANRRRMVWHVSSDRDLVPLPWRPSLRRLIHKIDKRLVDYGARHADSVIVQNAQQSALLRENYGRSDAVHIPNFHVAPGEPIVKATDRVTVCWIGNIKELKQPEMLLRLARDCADRANVEFVIAGGRQMGEQRWNDFLASVAALRNVRYLGQLSQQAVNDLLCSAHVLVNTSPVEGFPNTFIQAWLREVPVVSLAVNPDGVFDSDRYGICAAGSYPQLRSAVDRLVTDDTARRRIGKNASLFARERFSEANIDSIVRLLESAS